MNAALKPLDRTFVVGPFQCNCRLLACPKTGEAALVDPGDEPQVILEQLEKAAKDARALGLPEPRVTALFHTHGHLDHIGATRSVKEALAVRGGDIAEIWLHAADIPLYEQLQMQGKLFGLDYEQPLPVEKRFEDEQTLKIGQLKLTVLHTPGHSPGSVSLRLHEDSSLGTAETVYTGDTLFRESVGRTDLWGADGDAMFRSIRRRLLTLDDDTRVCPGHGPESSVGHEKRNNPFLT
ncbi:MAG TPA: MBL fold metallo-hydrolase [Bdellovibrionota bacterium]|jgi:glyoxylase-like metal-dependent hydrolase (beta-lactamase superfamily II)|nr:MBL fold metallo-hydrolase [Bdellovibrionota bacterium]